MIGRHRFLAVCFVLGLVAGLGAAPLRAQQAPAEGLLAHFAFDGDPAGQCVDRSGNGFHAIAGGSAVDSPSGQSMAFDGTAATVVSLTLPAEARIGTSSWGFMAWLKPTQFAIDDAQNQRRIFSFGAFPDANLVIDVTANGQVTWYFCYRDRAEDGPATQEGRIVSAGGSSQLSLVEGEWAHVALACDRERGEVSVYVNGYAGSPAPLPQGFAGDFSLSGDLSLGSGWHNYWGLMDEVRVYRRALSAEDVRAEFRAKRDVFGIAESPQVRLAERRERVAQAMADALEGWDRGDWATVRAGCAVVTGDAEVEPQQRSYAHLVLAQSYVREGDPASARAEYERIAATDDYPEVHRVEAAELARELEREARGLPARDPLATRTQVAAIEDFAAEVHVSPDGSDSADGSAERPLATLTAARDRVRALRAAGTTGAILVSIAGGRYPVAGTLALTAEDSGTETGPTVYRAAGEAVFYGGAELGGFEPVTDGATLARLPEEGRRHVLRCDLRALGIEDYGELSVRGFGQPPAGPTLELFVDGKPMTIARWPNEGFVRIAQLVEPGSRETGVPSAFRYEDDRHARWADAEDLWLFGYFRWLWADAAIKVGKIDPEARTVTMAEAYNYGGGMSEEQGIKYYAFNLLEEIDMPGEWYLDRTAGVLYLYPPEGFEATDVEIGMFPETMITLTGVSNVRLEGLTLDLGRYRGIVLESCEDCLVAGCTVSRMADNGIMVLGGEAVTLLACDVHTIGRRATEIIGGDRETLTPGRHLVENCVIHDFGRIDRTYTPAIQLEGVGNRVVHNLMYNGTSSAMRIEGNDHIVEYNEFHHVVLESDDQGAIDIFMNPTYRGMWFRHNHFHDTGNPDRAAGVHGSAGIRFDDAISGMVVYGNVFRRSANGHFGAVQMNSGRDNVIDANLIEDCSLGISGGYYPGNSVWNALRSGERPAGFHMNDLYLERYPKIATMLDEPAVNHAWRNVLNRCGAFANNPGGLDSVANTVTDQADAPMPPGFRPIPVEEIGLYPSPYRER